MIIEPLLNWWGITISMVVIVMYGSFLFAKSKEDMIEEMKATRTDEFLDKPMLRAARGYGASPYLNSIW